MTLLKHEGRHAAQAQLASLRREIVDRLFHGVADVDQRCHLALVGFGARVAQHLSDLGMPAAAIDAPHQVAQPSAVRHPARGAALVQSTKVHKLHIEPADRRRLAEHLALQLASRVPGRLPAHCGIEREDQPPALSRFYRWSKRAGALDERIDLGTRRRRRRRLAGACWSGCRIVGCLVAFACH